MNARKIVDRNCSWSPSFDETSFVSVLHERGIWDREQYWMLEWALFDLISTGDVDADLCASVFQIFSYTLGSISSHLDPNDLFEIINFQRDDVYAFRERIRLVFEGFFVKRMPRNASFDEVNPLLPKDAS
ncbi:Imm41 family immunity protein [Paraburkholderia phenoliruptrix]|uniref:Imm41 family immunity protein n=1 Tax=Paraburkholderia phenoliruptrix TaxID=252970 RepID=UPI0001FAF343